MIHTIIKQNSQISDLATKLIEDNPGIMRKNVIQLLVDSGFTRCAVNQRIRLMVEERTFILDTSERNAYRLYIDGDALIQRTVPAVFNAPAMCGPRRDPLGWSVNMLQISGNI